MGDERVDSNHVDLQRVEPTGNATLATRINNQILQMSVRGFLTDIYSLALEPTPTVSGINTNLTASVKVRYKGTKPANKGFPFCTYTPTKMAFFPPVYIIFLNSLLHQLVRCWETQK